LPPQRACSYFSGPVHWAVLGDSHAVEIGYALAEKLRTRNAGGLLHLSASGCMPAYSIDSSIRGCGAWTRSAVELLTSRKDITHVVVVYRHGFYLSGSPLDWFPDIPDQHPRFAPKMAEADARESYWSSFADLIAALSAAGKQVYVLDPIPELAHLVEWYVFIPSLRDAQATRLQVPGVDYYQRRHAFLLRKLDKFAADPRVIRVRTRDAFCGNAECRFAAGGSLLYIDDNHASLEGAARIVDLFLK
jgi:hypothetical protein